MQPYGRSADTYDASKRVAQAAKADGRSGAFQDEYGRGANHKFWRAEYDPEGNLINEVGVVYRADGTSASDVPITRMKLGYDARNQLFEVGVAVSPDSQVFSPQVRLNYDYDSDGRLVQRV